MNDLIETIEYKGYDIKIYPDEFVQNPRTDWDNMGKMICWHSGYNLGDKHNHTDTYDLMAYIGGVDSDLADELDDEIYGDMVRDAASKKAVILPLYLYDHSGITMSTGSFSCPWDSGQVGWIYVTLDDVNNWRGEVWKRWSAKRRAMVAEWLESEVETYDNYITGSVYGYRIESDDGLDDSCWGFYGYDNDKNGLFEHAKPAIDYHIEQLTKDAVKLANREACKLKGYIKIHLPLIYRKPNQINI